MGMGDGGGGEGYSETLMNDVGIRSRSFGFCHEMITNRNPTGWLSDAVVLTGDCPHTGGCMAAVVMGESSPPHQHATFSLPTS